MVVQLSFKTLFLEMMKICNEKHKKIFIDMVQKMVLKNTEIAIHCGMIMHHAVMNCIANNIIQISVLPHRILLIRLSMMLKSLKLNYCLIQEKHLILLS